MALSMTKTRIWFQHI